MNWDDYTWNCILKCCKARTVRAFLCTCKRFHRIMCRWQYARYKCLPYLTDSYLEALAIMDNPDLFQMAMRDGLVSYNDGIGDYLIKNNAYRIVNAMNYKGIMYMSVVQIVETHSNNLLRRKLAGRDLNGLANVYEFVHAIQALCMYNRPRMLPVLLDAMEFLTEEERERLVHATRSTPRSLYVLRGIHERFPNDAYVSKLLSTRKRKRVNDFV